MFSDSFIPYTQTWYGWIPKMAIDQTVYAFAWNVLYMGLIGRCKGQDVETIVATVGFRISIHIYFLNENENENENDCIYLYGSIISTVIYLCM